MVVPETRTLISIHSAQFFIQPLPSVTLVLPGVPLPWKVPAVKQFGKRMDYEHPADLTEHYCFGGSDSRAAAVGGTAFRGGAVCMVQS
jgi:hypothetical protein